jgi:hypothetical protein
MSDAIELRNHVLHVTVGENRIHHFALFLVAIPCENNEIWLAHEYRAYRKSTTSHVPALTRLI